MLLDQTKMVGDNVNLIEFIGRLGIGPDSKPTNRPVKITAFQVIH